MFRRARHKRRLVMLDLAEGCWEIVAEKVEVGESFLWNIAFSAAGGLVASLVTLALLTL